MAFRLLIGDLLVLMLFLVVPAPAIALKGDVNLDGVVTVEDVFLALRAQTGLASLTPEQEAAADVAPLHATDQTFDLADLALFLRGLFPSGDIDGDLLSNQIELPFISDSSNAAGRSPFEADGDGDGLCDGPITTVAGVCSGGEDQNANGLVDVGESDFAKVDSDGDGLCDGPAPVQGCTGFEDKNANGVRDPGETDPLMSDSDGDGLCDANTGTTLGCVGFEDSNANGIRDSGETDPASPDSDTDGVCDGPILGSLFGGCFGGEDLNGNGAIDLGETNPLDSGDASPPTDVPCPRCFAVALMPDTQSMPASHVSAVTRYACQNSAGWVEPTTGKTMPIVAVLHEGDIVDNGEVQTQWPPKAAAFDLLDSCVNPLPYVVAPGNHDFPGLTGAAALVSDAIGLNTYFRSYCPDGGPGCDYRSDCTVKGSPECGPWDPPTDCTQDDECIRGAWDKTHYCTNQPNCDPSSGEWFLGIGDDILAGSRGSGPADDQPGRHRAIVVDQPNNIDGEQILFIAMDYAFRFSNPDELKWIEDLLDLYPGTPAVLIHHEAFASGKNPRDPGVGVPGGGTFAELWTRLLDPRPDILLGINGHWGASDGSEDLCDERTAGAAMWSIYRNFQWPAFGGGDGWTPMVVFDPEAGEIRLRNYRVDDRANYGTKRLLALGAPGVAVDITHDGVPMDTAFLDKDILCDLTLDASGEPVNASGCERIIPWGATSCP